MEKVFRAEGIETEVIQVGGKPIADCLQCNVCGTVSYTHLDVYKRQVDNVKGSWS